MGEEVEEGGWWVYEKERASRIEGRVTDQHNRHCQPTRSSRFYVWGFGSLPLTPHPGQGQARSFIIPLRPLIFSFFNCLRPHRAFCHPHSISSPPFAFAAGPLVSSHTRCCAPLPPPRFFIGLPAIPPPNAVAYHRLLRHAQTGRPVSHQALQGTKQLVLVPS